MELSPEDSLRLNVLLRQQPVAIRVDERQLLLQALTPRGEASMSLNPGSAPQRYLRRVREMLSIHALGSPGGYPGYIQRWTRLGQSRDRSSLEKLLLLGEDEAVVAAANSPNLDAELASRAWWANPTPEIARLLLRLEAVQSASLGKELARYLLEFLPFETEPQLIIQSVQVMLHPGLLEQHEIDSLWARGKRKPVFHIGFLYTLADALPMQAKAHPLLNAVAQLPDPVASAQLQRSYSPAGQAFIQTARHAFDKLPDQDAAVALIEAIGGYFSPLRPDQSRYHHIDELDQRSAAAVDMQFATLLAQHPQWREPLQSMLWLSLLSEYIAAPLLGQTDAIGSVMRDKLEPISAPICRHLQQLG